MSPSAPALSARQLLGDARVVGTGEHGGALPGRLERGVGEDVLGHAVDVRGEGHVVGLARASTPTTRRTACAPMSIAVAVSHPRSDDLAHLVVEVGEVPLVRTLDDAVHRDEEVRHDPGHGLLLRFVGWDVGGRHGRPRKPVEVIGSGLPGQGPWSAAVVVGGASVGRSSAQETRHEVHGDGPLPVGDAVLKGVQAASDSVAPRPVPRQQLSLRSISAWDRVRLAGVPRTEVAPAAERGADPAHLAPGRRGRRRWWLVAPRLHGTRALRDQVDHGGLAAGVVRRLGGHLDVVRVALLERGLGDADELAALLQVGWLLAPT